MNIFNKTITLSLFFLLTILGLWQNFSYAAEPRARPRETEINRPRTSHEQQKSNDVFEQRLRERESSGKLNKQKNDGFLEQKQREREAANQENYQARNKQNKPTEISTISKNKLPTEARGTLKNIEQGGNFKYKEDGTNFRNDEKRLPIKEDGYYSEFTVDTPNSHDRAERRIVVGKNGEKYYTSDHYKTFEKIDDVQ